MSGERMPLVQPSPQARPRRPRLTQPDPAERRAVQDEPGTILERRVSWWLRQRHWEYQIQVPMLGGRLLSGGTVIDHVLPLAFPRPKALYEHGAYWHRSSAHNTQAEDNRREPLLAALGYDVVIVPENVIMSDYALNEFMERRIGNP